MESPAKPIKALLPYTPKQRSCMRQGQRLLLRLLRVVLII
jgi:hypothetical protein